MDPITDVVIAGSVAEDIIAAAGSILTGLEELLGYDGMQAAYDIIHGLGEIEIETILPQIRFNEGAVEFIGSSLDMDNLGNILSAFGRIAKILFDQGVDLATSAGQELFASIIKNLKEYGGGLTAAAVGTYVGNEAIKFIDSKKTKVEGAIEAKLGIDGL